MADPKSRAESRALQSRIDRNRSARPAPAPRGPIGMAVADAGARARVSQTIDDTKRVGAIENALSKQKSRASGGFSKGSARSKAKAGFAKASPSRGGR